jgi:hypothetical protein
MENVIRDSKLNAGIATGETVEAQNPTVKNKRLGRDAGVLDNKSRLKPERVKLFKRREGVLRERAEKQYTNMIQQQSLPDRRYALNNVPSQQLKYYNGGNWDMRRNRIFPKEYVYRQGGIPYIPAWKVLDEQPAVNLLDANPDDSSQVMLPDIYYQNEDRRANPRTEDQNAAQKAYERRMEHLMTNHLLKNQTLWNRHMLLNYIRKNPDEFYQPVQIFQEPLSAEEQVRFNELSKSRGILRRPNGKYSER